MIIWKVTFKTKSIIECTWIWISFGIAPGPHEIKYSGFLIDFNKLFYWKYLSLLISFLVFQSLNSNSSCKLPLDFFRLNERIFLVCFTSELSLSATLFPPRCWMWWRIEGVWLCFEVGKREGFGLGWDVGCREGCDDGWLLRSRLDSVAEIRNQCIKD